MHLNYIDNFIKMNCSTTLFNLRMFPDGKEITESMAMINAIKKCLTHISLKKENVLCNLCFLFCFFVTTKHGYMQDFRSLNFYIFFTCFFFFFFFSNKYRLEIGLFFFFNFRYLFYDLSNLVE